jgi:hypothetical protein
MIMNIIPDNSHYYNIVWVRFSKKSDEYLAYPANDCMMDFKRGKSEIERLTMKIRMEAWSDDCCNGKNYDLCTLGALTQREADGRQEPLRQNQK